MIYRQSAYQGFAFALFAFFAILLLATPGSAEAMNFNTSHQATSGNWDSLLLKLGSDGAGRAAISNESVSVDYMLTVDFELAHCSWAEVGLINPTTNYLEKKIKGLATLDARVDTGPIYEGVAFYSASRGDNAIVWNFMFGPKQEKKLLSNVESGDTLRLKISGKTADTRYLSFSLLGSRSAINRAQNLCIANQPNSKFFPAPKTQQDHSSRSDDGTTGSQEPL